MNKFEVALHQLRQHYLAKLPQHIETLETTWSDYMSDADSKRLDDLYRLAHNLVGSCATYGFPDITNAARDVELLLKPFFESNLNMAPQKKQALQDKLLLLKSTYERSMAQQAESPTSRNKRFSPLQIGTPKQVQTILVADDDVDARRMLTMLLVDMGYHVIQADNGKHAVDMFVEKKPNMVFMDIVMPEMDGYQAATKIKMLAKNQFIPIIFLTATSDENELANCISAGGDDFLVKSASRLPLQAKIISFERITGLYKRLEHYHHANEEELQLAKHVFNAVLKRNNRELTNVQCWNLAAGHLSGDVQLFDHSPGNQTNLFIGDFTGHGLPAAVGTLIAADIFYSMTQKSLSPSTIIAEINNKLNNTLPMGRYCAACFIHIDYNTGQILIWNCGLPDAYAVSSDGNIDHTFTSRFMPLGIMPLKEKDLQPENYSLRKSSLLLAHSDGITEALNDNNKFYGTDGLINVIRSNHDCSDVFDSVVGDVLVFLGETAAIDDISLLTVDLRKPPEIRTKP